MLINENVHDDFRINIIIDKDNPVLAFKANRDRFLHKDYCGLPHLGSVNSEDAITWNLIRTLSITDDYSPIENLINIKFKNPKVLLWTLSFDNISNDLQYTTGSIIRNIDGRHNGQITEPDIIIETDEHLIVFECKLGEKGKFPNHIWNSQKNSKGPEVRRIDYFKNDLFKKDASGYTDNAYQLFRMVFYANEIASKLNKKPVFISLVNKSWWSIRRNDSTPSKIWENFVSQVNTEIIILKNVFWQDLKITNNEKLLEYLSKHRCL